MTTPKTVLTKALQLLREKGWAQNAFEDSSGRICLRKAVMDASAKDDVLAQKALWLLWRNGAYGVFNTASGFRGGVEGWNDAPGRTFQEVEKLLEVTIALA